MNEEKKEFAVGDLVVVSGACETELYSNGDVGSIEEILYNGEIFIDFSNQNNNFVFDDGRWCCNKEEIKHYTPVEDLPLWKDNYMYLNNEQQQALRKLLHRVQWDDEYAEKIFYAKEATYLVDSFVWDETDEGSNYWSNIEDQCVNEEVPQHIEEEETERTDYTSEYFLQRAIDLQRERGKEYDNGQERSMGKIVEVFNIITSNKLSESDGWLFMQILKDVRQWTKPEYHQDSAEDCVSYAALKAEALASGK